MKLVFYYAAGANCCERVRWALDYKRVPFDLVNLSGAHDENHLRSISPFGRVPILEINGTALSESMAMVELLEEIYLSRPLNYTEPLARAHVREICEAVNSSIHPVQNSSVVKHFLPSLSKNEMQFMRANWIANNLEKLQTRLWQGSNFAVGEQFTLADIFIASIFRKGVTIGIQKGALELFESHWTFLMSHPEIRRCCPLLDEHG